MLNVLIADDHEVYREGLAQLIRRISEDAKISHAGTYHDAMRAIAGGGRFDLILVGLNMPPLGDMAGISALTREAKAMPVVIVSATYDTDTFVRTAVSGARGFLLKSASFDAMQDALALVLEGGSYFPADAGAMAAAAGAPAGGATAEDMRVRLDMLTHRQRDVLALLGEGHSNKDIAETLAISEGTVKVHVGAILKALGAVNRTQAALTAIDFGLAKPRYTATNARRA